MNLVAILIVIAIADAIRVLRIKNANMIRGYFDHDPDHLIPLENTEILDQNNMTETLLPVGTKVIVTNDANPDGVRGTLRAVDTEDKRTLYPYCVDFGQRTGWVRKQDVTKYEPTDESTLGPIATVCIALLFIVFALCSCTGNKKPQPVKDTLQFDTLHSELKPMKGDTK